MNTANFHKIIFPVGRITSDGVKLLGTCFLLNGKGLFATAAHVTNNNDSNLVLIFTDALYNSDKGINSYQDTSNKRVAYSYLTIYKIDPIHDICILKSEDDAISNIIVSSTDNVDVSEDVCILGYPHCDRGRMVLTYQETTIGAKILLETSNIKTKHIVLNIQTRPGQSGSPVFRKSDSTLVAIIIGSYAPNNGGGILLGGVDPLTLHQTTHAVSAEYIDKML